MNVERGLGACSRLSREVPVEDFGGCTVSSFQIDILSY